MITAHEIWENRNRKVAGPWKWTSHPNGDSRGIWMRQGLRGADVAWLEAPPMTVPEGAVLFDYLRRPLVNVIPNPFHIPDGDTTDYWPTLQSDKERMDEALKEKGYELVEEKLT